MQSRHTAPEYTSTVTIYVKRQFLSSGSWSRWPNNSSNGPIVGQMAQLRVTIIVREKNQNADWKQEQAGA
jgi:hypothetical protein